MGFKEMVTGFDTPGQIESDGGKGYNLKELTQNGINVPEGLVISSEFYTAHYPAPPDFDFEDETALADQCLEMQRAVAARPLPDGLIEAVDAFTAAAGKDETWAVRSSSTFEDLAGAAFAGQHDTYLNIKPGDIGIHIQKCLASLWGKHAVLYRRHQGFSQEEASMAVVVQRMIKGDVAGVAFSVDPVSGDLSQVLLEGNWGIGESVVGGEASTDSWVVDVAAGEIVQRRVCEKFFQYVPAETGIVKAEIPEGERKLPCLSDSQVLRIAKKARQLMGIYGAPQDMEWVVEKDRLYIVQSRPQTTIPARFTRDESAERFPEPLTPLTWSYVEETFNTSLEYSLDLMQVSLPTRPWFALKNHYVYGNQNAVQLMALHRPIRADSIDALIEQIPQIMDQYAWVMDLPQKWLRDLDRYLLKMGALGGRDLDDLDCERFQAYLREMFDAVTDYFKPNIAISMTQSFLTRTLLGIIEQITGDSLTASDLLKKIISTPETKTGQINREIFMMARMAAADGALMAALENGGRAALGRLDEFEDFSREFKAFIGNYGHREISFDYYHPTWAEAPEVVLDLICLTASSDRMEDPRERELAARDEQLKATRELYEKTPETMHFFLSELIRMTLNFTFLDDLEHFQTTRANLIARRAVGAFGRAVQKNTAMEDPYDLFFLTKEEFESISDFRLEASLLKNILERKKAFLKAGESEPPWNLDGGDEAPVELTGDTLKGIPGSPGECEGEAYLVRGVADFAGMPENSILIAKTTNPSWTPLFYKAKAVVTESGGPLSHGAVTAREIGLPAVMNVHNCMAALSNGDRIYVNGRQGIVKRG
ncbi:MAG: phosphoenolpyruvate synthase [Desulfobacter sp.]|nr:MAG: phosphoenolpyruvate synthase [Desulfobacter sp.]